MKYNSAQAAKLLSKLQQDFDQLAVFEANAKTFLASVGEDPESVRPEYDYKATKKELDVLSAKIRKVKHAINAFKEFLMKFYPDLDEGQFLKQLEEFRQLLSKRIK